MNDDEAGVPPPPPPPPPPRASDSSSDPDDEFDDDDEEEAEEEEEEEPAQLEGDLSDEDDNEDEALIELEVRSAAAVRSSGAAAAQADQRDAAAANGGGAVAGPQLTEREVAIAVATAGWAAAAVERFGPDEVERLSGTADAEPVIAGMVDAIARLQGVSGDRPGFVPLELWSCCGKCCVADLFVGQLETALELSARGLYFKQAENTRPERAVRGGNLFVRTIKAKSIGRKGDASKRVRAFSIGLFGFHTRGAVG